MDPGVGCAWAGMTSLLLLLLGWYEREGMWARCLHRLWYSPLPPTGYMEYAKVSGEREDQSKPLSTFRNKIFKNKNTPHPKKYFLVPNLLQWIIRVFNDYWTPFLLTLQFTGVVPAFRNVVVGTIPSGVWISLKKGGKVSRRSPSSNGSLKGGVHFLP